MRGISWRDERLSAFKEVLTHNLLMSMPTHLIVYHGLLLGRRCTLSAGSPNSVPLSDSSGGRSLSRRKICPWFGHQPEPPSWGTRSHRSHVRSQFETAEVGTIIFRFICCLFTCWLNRTKANYKTSTPIQIKHTYINRQTTKIEGRRVHYYIAARASSVNNNYNK